VKILISNIELVLDAKASLAEGPCWNENIGAETI